MCKLCDDDAKYGHEPAEAQSRVGEAGANLTDVLERKLPKPTRYFSHSELMPMYTKDEMVAFAAASILDDRENMRSNA